MVKASLLRSGVYTNYRGLNVSASIVAKLLSVDVDGWLEDVLRIRDDFAKFGPHLPEGMRRGSGRTAKKAKR